MKFYVYKVRLGSEPVIFVSIFQQIVKFCEKFIKNDQYSKKTRLEW